MTTITVSKRGIGNTAGDFRVPFGPNTSTTDRTASSTARFVAFPFFFDQPTTVDLCRIHLVTAQAGSEYMAGIYENSNARPTSLIVDMGTIDTATGSGTDKDFSGFSAPTVFSWIWVIIAMNATASVVVKGPTGSGSMLGMFPAQGTYLSSSGADCQIWLQSATAYPASMPATAPTMDLSTSLTFPLPMLRVA